MGTLTGAPQLRNGLHHRYHAVPLPFKGKEDAIEPIYLLALKQVHDTLYAGSYKCALYPYCDVAANNPGTDYDCVNAPWEWSKKTPTCAFGALWLLFGFADKEVIVR